MAGSRWWRGRRIFRKQVSAELAERDPTGATYFGHDPFIVDVGPMAGYSPRERARRSTRTAGSGRRTRRRRSAGVGTFGDQRGHPTVGPVPDPAAYLAVRHKRIPAPRRH